MNGPSPGKGKSAVNYRIIRSRRKTIGLEVDSKGLTVRAPYFVSAGQIDDFVNAHSVWIRRHLEKEAARRKAVESLPPITDQDLKALARKAREYIPGRVEFFARRIGVTYGRITIRNQCSRWGSCSGKGNLNFNCLLMLTPPEVIDSVVVHELCHRKEMNHSPRFYAEVLKIFPEYKKWDKWLKENGKQLLERVTAGK